MGFRSLLDQATQISGSFTYDDSLSMASAESYEPKTLEADLNYVRSQLKVITGEANWFDAPVESLHDFNVGLSGSFANIQSFTGQSDVTDSAPTYSSTSYVTQGNSLEAAIGELDAAIDGLAGVKVTERLTSTLNAETAHTLPGGNSYTPAEGANMDVYVNGELQQADITGEERDYAETSTTQVTFHFKLRQNAFITYVIRG
jgi:hypothetical protein